MSNYEYVNFKNNVGDSPNLIKINQLPKLDPNKNYYISVFRYNEQHKQIQETEKSLAGIRDTVTDVLLWDFDSADLNESKTEAIELCRRLVEDYNVDPDHIRVAFSGSKGFHVSIPLDRTINAESFKKAVMEIAGDLKIDPTVTHANCLIRVMGTVNQKSGLYKIPLTVYELDEMTIDDIKALAKAPRDRFVFPDVKVKLPESLFAAKEKVKKEIMTEDNDFDYSNPPRGWKKYKWSLAQGWFESGERHTALMIVAATCRGLGYDKTTTYHICKSAIEKQARRLGEDKFDKAELFENIIEKSVFGPNWDGGQFGPEHPWLKKYCARMKIDVTKDVDHIVQLHNIEEEFTDFVTNIEKNTILTGIPELDKALPLTVGMNMGILGAPSSGKTALALKILENTSNAGVVSVFASLDMRRNRLFEKLLYRVTGLSREKLYTEIREGRAAPIYEKVREKYKNVYFYDRSSPSVADVQAYCLHIEEQTGKKVKLVMVDYFERISAERSDETAASKEVSGKLQDLVNDLNVCLITLVQPNKFSITGGPDSPLLSYSSIKGSSFMSQSFRSVISIWRPFFTPELKDNDRFLQMAILKNDLGELDVLNFGWDGKRGEIWGLAPEGEEELDRLLKQKEQKKTEKADDGWGDFK